MEKTARTASRALLAAAVALLALLVLSSSASAEQDELKGGSVTMQLQSSRGLKLKPSSLSLPITGGAVDPINGSGTVEVRGSFKAGRGKGRTKVTITGLTFGANGGRGKIAAKVGKGKVLRSFGALSGGSVTRDGFGARIDGVRATLTAKGAKRLAVRGGQPLGTVSATTIPETVQVVPGSGSIKLVTNPLISGSLASKLAAHCIDASPLGSPPGAAAVPPATFDVPTFTFTFPVAGGAVAPDFSDGRLISGGGQTITKNNTPIITPGACSTNPPPVGTSVLSTEFEAQFSINALAANTTLPTGPLGLAALGPIDFSTGSRSIDPATGKLSVDNATVTLDGLTAFVLNQVFPNESGNSANDFAPGDLVGTLSMTAKLR